MTYAVDGSYYEGMFKHDQQHGEGVHRSARGLVQQKGRWKEGTYQPPLHTPKQQATPKPVKGSKLELWGDLVAIMKKTPAAGAVLAGVALLIGVGIGFCLARICADAPNRDEDHQRKSSKFKPSKKKKNN